MYNYAVYQNALDKNSPFIVFNCADYASNPQLLVSHIFGHVKGAFTGATRDKFGLLSEADGGMLFLDEVHRLPPEGQEMIFYFMDTGTYGLLGRHSVVVRHKYYLFAPPPKSLILRCFPLFCGVSQSKSIFLILPNVHLAIRSIC